MSNKSKLYVALVLLAAVGVSIALWHNRLSADFIPLDHSNVGPNLVASAIQAVVVFLVLVLLYPPFQKAMERIAHEANAELHEKLKVNETLLKHVIRHHPDIPNTDRNGKLLVDPLPEPVKKAAPRKRAAKKVSPT